MSKSLQIASSSSGSSHHAVDTSAPGPSNGLQAPGLDVMDTTMDSVSTTGAGPLAPVVLDEEDMDEAPPVLASEAQSLPPKQPSPDSSERSLEIDEA